MRKTAVLILSIFCLVTAVLLSGCGGTDNSDLIGEWKPSTVSIGGTTISYSDLDTEDKDFSITFFANGKCRVVIGGISNDGTYTFHETSVDIQYGGKSQKLSYDNGILTLKLDYHNTTTAYMFTKVAG